MHERPERLDPGFGTKPRARDAGGAERGGDPKGARGDEHPPRPGEGDGVRSRSRQGEGVSVRRLPEATEAEATELEALVKTVTVEVAAQVPPSREPRPIRLVLTAAGRRCWRICLRRG